MQNTKYKARIYSRSTNCEKICFWEKKDVTETNNLKAKEERKIKIKAYANQLHFKFEVDNDNIENFERDSISYSSETEMSAELENLTEKQEANSKLPSTSGCSTSQQVRLPISNLARPRVNYGAIEKMLESCEKLPIVNFVLIVSPLPELDAAAIRNFSTDQKYLYEMCHPISIRNCLLDLAARNPGKLSQATKANRIFRLYIGNKCPSTNLRTIAKFVVKLYAPVWFDIKRNPLCSDGERHVFRIIQLSRYLNNELKAVIDSEMLIFVIRRTFY
ncbi:unnamed protein product [Psylliodes chrysocephalus]|uniref:Uncharacterized protein n=1 Tax=Psylliodes chrysocephalus TaxID=3402493 RepID=A0A9P0CJF0_9CUCU|nr:unnamed protein product [Psylliodes chrysocephala]